MEGAILMDIIKNISGKNIYLKLEISTLETAWDKTSIANKIMKC